MIVTSLSLIYVKRSYLVRWSLSCLNRVASGSNSEHPSAYRNQSSCIVTPSAAVKDLQSIQYVKENWMVHQTWLSKIEMECFFDSKSIACLEVTSFLQKPQMMQQESEPLQPHWHLHDYLAHDVHFVWYCYISIRALTEDSALIYYQRLQMDAFMWNL